MDSGSEKHDDENISEKELEVQSENNHNLDCVQIKFDLDFLPEVLDKKTETEIEKDDLQIRESLMPSVRVNQTISPEKQRESLIEEVEIKLDLEELPQDLDEHTKSLI